MSLTLGSIAPLGRPTGGTLNVPVPDKPAHLLYVHDLPQRIRGEVAGATVVDTTAARMLHETRLLPRWYLPAADVRQDLLEPSDTTTHCPFKGDARYWNLRVGDRLITDAFWDYPVPGPGCPDLTGLFSPYVEKFDRWFEEDEEILGHPRDPFHRVDARRSSARVVVRAGGEEVASSEAPVALAETGLPLRWYLPLADVRQDLLVPSDTTTVCPYKGVATYWSVQTPEGRREDVAWTFPNPRPEALATAGCVAFLGEGIDVDVTRVTSA